MSRDDNYTTRQMIRDAAYARDYEAWVAGMSPQERAALGNLGLDRPQIEHHNNGSGTGLMGDIAESSLASDTPDIIDQIEPAHSDPTEQPGCTTPLMPIASDALWDVLRRLVGELLATPNRSLAVDCLALVSGLSYTGDSMTGIATRHGVTRAAVSKRCVELSEKLDLIPSRAMRALTARSAYRAAQIKVHTSYEP